MKKLSKFFYTIATVWVVLASTILLILFCVVFLPQFSQQSILYTNGAGLPDLKFSYTGSQLYSMAEAYGAAGRQYFINSHWTYDLVFPILYTFFLIVSISGLLRNRLPSSSGWTLLNLVPLIAFIFDLGENAATSLVMLAYPRTNIVAQAFSPVFTPVKWIGVLASSLVLVFAIIQHFVHRNSSKVLEDLRKI